MEKLDYLIEYLLEEENRIIDEIPNDKDKKKKIYRALVNIREPKEISPDFLKAEDEYLQEELFNSKVDDVDTIKSVKELYGSTTINNSDKIFLWQGDITKIKIDAIVNAANSRGLGCFSPNHICIDNQIHTFAGVRLRLECNEIMKNKNYNLETSEAIITKGYNLPAKYVIHTVGPIIDFSVTKQKEDLLAKTYINSLCLAIQNNIRTIAFPCISTGIFRFPKDKACGIAVKAVDNFLSENKDKIDKVVFNVFDREDFDIYERYFKNDK